MDHVGTSPLTVIPSPQFPAAQLPRVASSSLDAIQTFIDTASPAVITKDAVTTGLGRLLTPEDLRGAFGSGSVTVSAINGDALRYDAESTLAQRMPFADFAEYVENPDHPSTERLYLSQFPLDAIPLALGFDLAAPPYIPDGSHRVAENLWFGPAGTISPLHVDRSHNLLVQHWGRKHVVMVSPHHSSLMMPGSKNSKSPHVSSLNLVTNHFEIDLSRLSASCFETIVEPGDVLFVPAFWWHNVMSLDAAISTNYWWRPPIDTCLYPNFFRMVSSRGVYDDPSIVHRWVDVAPHQLDTGLCLFLADAGHTFGAGALAAALVTAFCERTLQVLGLRDSSRPPRRDDGAGTSPEFAQSVMVVSALTAQGVIDSSQSNLLLEWLTLAEETAAEPEPRVYAPERSAIIHDMISRLHVECGSWLST